MTPFDYRPFYSRHRPHIHSPGSTLFVTFRLVDSVPKIVVKRYQKERLVRERDLALLNSEAEVEAARIEFHRRWFVEFENILDKAANGPMWLGIPEIRSIVHSKLVDDDGSKYRLDAFSIMSNHVHVVFRPNLDDQNLIETIRGGRVLLESDSPTLAQSMQSLKGVTARDCNKVLGRSGQFWEHESYDHEIRGSTGFIRAVRYTLNNPVKAGLVTRPMDWPGNFISPRLRERPEFEDLVR